MQRRSDNVRKLSAKDGGGDHSCYSWMAAQELLFRCHQIHEPNRPDYIMLWAMWLRRMATLLSESDQAALYALFPDTDAEPIGSPILFCFISGGGDARKRALHRTRYLPNGGEGILLHDVAYYWPQYTPISSAADYDLMLFTVSKTRVPVMPGCASDEDVMAKRWKAIERGSTLACPTFLPGSASFSSLNPVREGQNNGEDEVHRFHESFLRGKKILSRSGASPKYVRISDPDRGV
ncbi:hypothetical protein GQ457_12G007950 [Hibiscus cannabinus]